MADQGTEEEVTLPKDPPNASLDPSLTVEALEQVAREQSATASPEQVKEAPLQLQSNGGTGSNYEFADPPTSVEGKAMKDNDVETGGEVSGMATEENGSRGPLLDENLLKEGILLSQADEASLQDSNGYSMKTNLSETAASAGSAPSTSGNLPPEKAPPQPQDPSIADGGDITAVDGTQNEAALEGRGGERTNDSRFATVRMPESIVVEVPGEGSEAPRLITVYVQPAERRLPFAGGYRDKRNGVEYLHVSQQTERKPKPKAERKLSRDTQTYDMSTRQLQTVREASTQMVRPDLFLECANDTERTPGPYEDAATWAARRLHAAIVIQCGFRGMKARQLANELRQQARERRQFMAEEEKRRRREAEAQRRREIERRMHPRTQDDFQILYTELEAWRLQETKWIKESGWPEEDCRIALKQLLHKETKLLQTIDRLKIAAAKENRADRISSTMETMAAPKQWELKDGNLVHVQTPLTVRAAELMQLYRGLLMLGLTVDERLDVLLHVKWTVREFDCALTREIAELIDREADLLNRGRPSRSLEGLRKRISSLFLQFVETPEFNPEATSYQLVPRDFDSYEAQSPTRHNSRPPVYI